MLSEFVELAIAAALFVGAHFILSSAPVRNRLIAVLGLRVYLLGYSAIALAVLAWLLWSFRLAPYYWVWGSPQWTRILVFAIMPFAAMLLVAGLLAPNPSALFGERLLARDEPPRGIFQITRHPVMIGIALWAATHLIANGDAAGIILFGSLLVLALGGIAHVERRRRANGDPHWQRFAAQTSILPFAAILAGHARLSLGARDAACLAAGLALYAALLVLHGPAFGIYLLGKP